MERKGSRMAIQDLRANPAKVGDFGDKDLLQDLIWRESFSAKWFHFAGMRAVFGA
jgi:hypothetical protein